MKGFRLLVALALILMVLVLPGGTAFAATSANVTITFQPSWVSMTNNQSTWAIGGALASTDYWSTGNTSAPSFPLAAANCTFSANNTGTVSVNLSMHGHDFTGGAGVSLVNTVPTTDEVRIIVIEEGEVQADNVTLTTSDQLFKGGINPAVCTNWTACLTTGDSYSDNNTKTGIVTLSVVQS